MDAAGDLWVAIFAAGGSSATPPTAYCVEELHVPAAGDHVLRVRGPGLSRLYVTTATEDWSDEQRRAEPTAGLTYRFDTDATGRPAAPFRPDRRGGPQ